MVKTLEELKEKVLRNPEKYGRFKYFDSNEKPICPIAIEIIPDYFKHYISTNFIVSYAAEKLNCSVAKIREFTDWWDSIPEYNFKNEGE